MLAWFKEHLNWAYFTAFVFYYFACFLVGLILGSKNAEASDGLSLAVSAFLFFAIMVPVSVIIIRAKGRSLWWLLLAGWFSPLWLTSKKKSEVR